MTRPSGEPTVICRQMFVLPRLFSQRRTGTHLCPFVHRRPTNPKTSLLFVILSLVFMKGGVVKDSECQRSAV